MKATKNLEILSPNGDVSSGSEASHGITFNLPEIIESPPATFYEQAYSAWSKFY